jgi:2-dehydropantoate 2-reductase
VVSQFVPTSVAVIGAGAVGSYYGAKLARTGIDVTLVARREHAAAIERDGLRVIEAGDEWRVELRASTDSNAAARADVVLVTVKTPDTTAAASALAGQLSPHARIVSLQNGVDNAERIAALLPNPVFAAVVYVGVQLDGPGRVRHTGRGDLVLGVPRTLASRGNSGEDLRGIAAMFRSFGHRLSDRSGNRSCALDEAHAQLRVQRDLGPWRVAVRTHGCERSVRSIMEAVVRETVAVARAANISIDADVLVAATWRLADSMPDQYSSTAQDIQRGKATEIDALNGFVAQKGAALGVDTPVNRTLHALVKLREMAQPQHASH